MSNTNANFEMTGILLGQEARQRTSPQEKIAIIQQSMEPGMSVSHVASLLFKRKKQYQECSLAAVAAGEEVVPASELSAALKQIWELHRLQGKKTMENEILKETVEYGQSREWIAYVPLLPKDKRQPGYGYRRVWAILRRAMKASPRECQASLSCDEREQPVVAAR